MQNNCGNYAFCSDGERAEAYPRAECEYCLRQRIEQSATGEQIHQVRRGEQSGGDCDCAGGFYFRMTEYAEQQHAAEQQLLYDRRRNIDADALCKLQKAVCRNAASPEAHCAQSRCGSGGIQGDDPRAQCRAAGCSYADAGELALIAAELVINKKRAPVSNAPCYAADGRILRESDGALDKITRVISSDPEINCISHALVFEKHSRESRIERE